MSSMSNRWKVEKSYGKWSASKQTIWGYGLAPRYFETHADAMVYAAERARTVEVTLPRDPLVWESGWDSDGRIYVEEANGNEICYEPGQLGEIALHLLAYHYSKGHQ